MALKHEVQELREAADLLVAPLYSLEADRIPRHKLTENELPPGFFFGTRNINAGRARSRGLEAEADWTISPQWSATLGYTLADSTITAAPCFASR